MPFYDADISGIIQGPGNAVLDPDVAWEYDGHTFSVAVALEEIPASTERTISYRFLGDDQNNYITSAILQVPGVQGEINFARVASCFFVDVNQPDNTWQTFVEVAIVYQIEEAGQRDIQLVRMGFDPIDFVLNGSTIPVTEPAWTVAPYEIFDGDGLDQIMPDIAYDPRRENMSEYGGNVYVTFVRYIDAHHTKIFGVEIPRANIGDPWTQSNLLTEPLHPRPEPIQLQSYIENGFHPRIDVGFLSFPENNINFAEWKVGIAYTGDNDHYHPRVIMFEMPPNAPNYMDNGIAPLQFAQLAGGMPVIDIGPLGTNHAAVAWSQSRSESWNDVTVAYWDSLLNFFQLHPNSGVMSSASPSVCVHNRQAGSDIYQTSIAFLSTPNVNSHSWEARAMLVECNMTNPEEPIFTTHQPHHFTFTSFFGEFDIGSHYTNWYGLSSSITAYDDRYWALWSSIDQPAGQTAIQQVHGAYGFTNP
jgi:hypothetical protein